MVLFFDTSALVKRYVEEDGTESVEKLFKRAKKIIKTDAFFYQKTSGSHLEDKNWPPKNQIPCTKKQDRN